MWSKRYSLRISLILVLMSDTVRPARVDGERSDQDHRALGRTLEMAAQLGITAGEKPGHAEWRHHVVVGARPQQADHLIFV
jgi:hypothetical protein